jgi:hypothetical protein
MPCSPKSTCCFWKRSGAWPSGARPTPMAARGSSALRRTCPSNCPAQAGSRRGVASTYAVIPERCKASNYDVQLHIGESRDSGFASRPGMTASLQFAPLRRHVARVLHDDLVERAEIGLGRSRQRIRIGPSRSCKKIKIMSGIGQSNAPLGQIITRVLPGYPFRENGTVCRIYYVTGILRVIP